MNNIICPLTWEELAFLSGFPSRNQETLTTVVSNIVWQNDSPRMNDFTQRLSEKLRSISSEEWKRIPWESVQ